MGGYTGVRNLALEKDHRPDACAEARLFRSTRKVDMWALRLVLSAPHALCLRSLRGGSW